MKGEQRMGMNFLVAIGNCDSTLYTHTHRSCTYRINRLLHRVSCHTAQPLSMGFLFLPSTIPRLTPTPARWRILYHDRCVCVGGGGGGGGGGWGGGGGGGGGR